jgi:nifR3 family TIM-barrel protein
MSSFDWNALAQPFFCMAPMEGATDSAFRRVVHDCGRPDVSFTEFVNVEGLMSAGAVRLEPYLMYDPSEHPLIVQLWGLDPDNFSAVADRMVERGFDGVDINMGCPDKAVIKKGTGGALINNKPLAAAIIQAVKRGVAGRVPVSVKIRIGYKKIETEAWARFVLAQGIDALTVHGRTVAELSRVPNHWDEIEKVVKIRDELGLTTKIIGNGDVESLDQARAMADVHGVDGIMIGRGVFKNPWVFAKEDRSMEKEDRIALLRKHLNLYETIFGEMKPYEPMKRFFKIYIQQFPGAVELRDRLMHTRNRAEAEGVLNEL